MGKVTTAVVGQVRDYLMACDVNEDEVLLKVEVGGMALVKASTVCAAAVRASSSPVWLLGRLQDARKTINTRRIFAIRKFLFFIVLFSLRI